MSPYLVPVISALLVCVLGVYVLMLKRSIYKNQETNLDLIDGLAEEVKGVSHGSMGVGRRLLEVEQELDDLKIKVEEMRRNDPSNVSYSEASRLVSLGANVDDLMDSCGISRPEAELVSALRVHQNDDVPILTPDKI